MHIYYPIWKREARGGSENLGRGGVIFLAHVCISFEWRGLTNGVFKEDAAGESSPRSIFLERVDLAGDAGRLDILVGAPTHSSVHIPLDAMFAARMGRGGSLFIYAEFWFYLCIRSILLFIVCILCFVWRIPKGPPLEGEEVLVFELGPKIAVTVLLGLGVLYFFFIAWTFRIGWEKDNESDRDRSGQKKMA